MADGDRLRTQETLEYAQMIIVSGSPNGIYEGPEGLLAWDTTNNHLYVNNDGATGWTQINK